MRFKALKKEPEENKETLFQVFIGQRMLVEDIAELIRPKEQTDE